MFTDEGLDEVLLTDDYPSQSPIEALPGIDADVSSMTNTLPQADLASTWSDGW